MKLRLYFDGLCEPRNPGGIACYGFVVCRNSMQGELNVSDGYGLAAEPSPDSTNNVAEYTALIRGLEWIQTNLKDREVEILGDSRLVIEQLNGRYKVKSPRIIPLHIKASTLLEPFKWTSTWIPREENASADELSLKAYREYCLKRYGRVPSTMRQTGAIE